MKTIIRLAAFLMAGFLVMMVAIGLFMSLIVEELLPALGLMEYASESEFYVMIAVAFLFCACFGWYFVKPGFYIQKWIRHLAEGIYQQPEMDHKVYSKRTGKLRSSYVYFAGVFKNLHILTDKLEQSKKEHQRLEKMKQEWISGISHDMKTPLSYITGYSTLLLSPDHTWSREEQQQFLAEIHEKARYMQDLISDLNLTLQMNERNIPLVQTRGDLVEFIRRVVADIASDPRANGYHLELHTKEDSLEIGFDAKLLYRICQNLLMNAIVHNLPGTRIEIHISKMDSEAKVDISDNGAGMDDVTLQHLFQKYYRGTSTDAPVAGTGLGMSIARQLIAAHGGRVEAESQAGLGTTISFWLPLSASDE
ncbi:sensor histidine kinase [Brevibacillus brevis]|uniref:sensor histidine kinase n=1 Tax=Brevibacillus brevis TaxID=1393 RepID=UPI0009EF5810|nr:HAMP domain-containing sensor histidine kinase [Brevibacillus brevis]